MGTKLRALYQRKKGRDLFDLHCALEHLDMDVSKIVECFHAYMQQEEIKAPSAREFELNMEEKMKGKEFIGDITALLRPEIDYNQDDAHLAIMNGIISKL